MTRSKYDAVWNNILDYYKVIEKIKLSKSGYIELTSQQIKDVAYGNEIRLLNTKLKNLRTIPPVFIKNNLSLLSTTKNHYAIGCFDTHQRVVYKQMDIKNPPNTSWLMYADTLYLGNIKQEKQMSAYVQNTDILEDIFGESMRSTLSGGGSMGSDKFNFKIHDILNQDKFYDLNVENATIEVDGCSEGKNIVVIQEYKPLPLNNFIIRQLYYPYRKLLNYTKKDIYIACL